MDESELPPTIRVAQPIGSADTFENVYKMEEPRLTRLFRHRLGAEDAKDFVQDLFVLLLAYGKHHQIAEPRALLGRLIRNKFSDMSRKRERYSHISSSLVDEHLGTSIYRWSNVVCDDSLPPDIGSGGCGNRGFLGYRIT